MSEPGIRRTRELEDQYAELSQKVETLCSKTSVCPLRHPRRYDECYNKWFSGFRKQSVSIQFDYAERDHHYAFLQSRHFIERTILSVLQQDYPNLQYIVLDSLSKDNTHKILERYRSEISIVIEAKDKGQADAINKGFAAGDGEILAYLNSDDCYSAPDTVSRAVKQSCAKIPTLMLFMASVTTSTSTAIFTCHIHTEPLMKSSSCSLLSSARVLFLD